MRIFAQRQGVEAVREGRIGYVPGSVVWVPLAMAQQEPEESVPRFQWLKRLLRRRRREPSVYQRVLAMHIGTASENKSAALS